MSSLQQANFLRAWKLSLNTKSDGLVVIGNDKTANPLRVTFSIEQRALLAYWTAEATLYNLNSTTSNIAISTGVPADKLWQFNQQVALGDFLSISAGYKFGTGGAFDPDANLIWQGNVLQPLWTRLNVVDYTVTLRCMLGLMQDAFGMINTTMAAGATPHDALVKIATDGKIDIDQGNIDEDKLTGQKFPRGQVLRGRPFDLLKQIAKANNLQTWLGPNGLQMRSLKFDPNTVPDYAYAAPGSTGTLAPKGTKRGIIKKTLLGVPVQTQNGVTFRVELDAMPKIGDLVQLSPGLAINKLAFTVGQFPAILDSDGIYIVGGIKHVGDTRGDDWYTEIAGFTANFFPDFLASSTSTPSVTI